MPLLDEPQHFCCLEADRKSTRLNSSHSQISYAVFCLKKKSTTALRTSAADVRRRQPRSPTEPHPLTHRQAPAREPAAPPTPYVLARSSAPSPSRSDSS